MSCLLLVADVVLVPVVADDLQLKLILLFALHTGF
jgi:hypothetical protein